MSPKNRLELTTADWVDQFSKTMALELVNLIEGQKKSRGPDIGRLIVANFVGAFIATVVYKSLSESPENLKTKKEVYEHTKASFTEMKIALQEAVAAGFQGAMSQFSGKEVEYYCQIKPVGTPPTKLHC